MTHNDLIQLMTTLGYPKSHEQGVCHGFTLMWVQAACTNQLDVFFERLDFLEGFVEHPDRLVSAIADARQKVINKKPLTSEDEQLLELSAFFDGISLYQEVQHSREIANTTETQFLNVERISTWIRPDCAPDRLHQVSCEGQYTESEFSDFLTHLAGLLESQPNSVLTLSTPSHTLGLLYKGKGIFEIIDTNVDKFEPTCPPSPRHCADILFNLFFEHSVFNDKLILRTAAFATNPDNLPDLSFEHQKQYTTLHVTPDNKSLLSIALQNDDWTLWNQLNLRDIPFEKMERATQNAFFRAACLFGHELVVRLLLQHEVRDYLAQFEQEGLLGAVENPKIMALLLQQGVPPNSRHFKGGSPLQYAVAKNKPKLAKLLLSHGTSIHYATDTLHLAAAQGHQEMVRLLVAHFPQLARAKDAHQLQPLDYAVIYGHHELIMELLPHTPMPPIGFYYLCKHLETEDKDLKKSILIEAFSRYITQRQQEFKPLSRFFSRLGRGYAEREKIAAATQVLEFLKTDAIELELESKDMAVLNNGRLYWLLHAVQDYLGADFVLKEKSLREHHPFIQPLPPEDEAADANASTLSPPQ
ncbi:MAG: hypothetical protein BGO90_03665 [Legionella sp. 40-6]|nr:ankyrin repeat domain-containing protein [Legionella sp.]OJX98681.1 MAG: hypothetical protein BGO90_03665 [Legionella sp. 40-6]